MFRLTPDRQFLAIECCGNPEPFPLIVRRDNLMGLPGIGKRAVASIQYTNLERKPLGGIQIEVEPLHDIGVVIRFQPQLDVVSIS